VGINAVPKLPADMWSEWSSERQAPGGAADDISRARRGHMHRYRAGAPGSAPSRAGRLRRSRHRRVWHSWRYSLLSACPMPDPDVRIPRHRGSVARWPR